ncbi:MULTISPECIES: LysR substrate-binding domain-containing protein [unclassified Polaromonas]|jgi:DNA-binding transcriptional LysR family regulator|uniref:LysR substrate-binding domain-containing protein n=1 Tax=unclassified Polaromonas TaxID=2638319 RepID=UPI000BD281B5|nr:MULTISPECIES: LysR substrate-binding domain-containing protein [unclassified Polaromonas]OYY37372.1 MAG: LysR family transcriptional regulator [Polaromonas sp. 35-63-35]OYZ21606.1 MAG: LysR family transcriptional regulator [Polaromonas sp. 16-63-31]OYZ77750.1 MAG: LysR family transcriptional regulator [Polaromonas sp. 24-63-21]OZA49924.1 MAG: LysR family transcriptional regulator [Polaromonas sp. 17-63-33]OZA87088.1 MAG: LysR family transcriptional regulator [Polaromonas sp. 39-63-25]
MQNPLDLRLLKTFILLVETGSVSETARRVSRTQPAVTLQLQKLEELVGARLYNTVGRKPVLTPEGELLLGYSRTILGLHNEVLTRLHAPRLGGRVILGIPDLYAAYVLPPVLSAFNLAHPNVDVEIRCSLSNRLMTAIGRDEIDVALVTGMPAFKQGLVVAQEPLVWVAGETGPPQHVNPLPLAMLPPGNIFRDHALAALDQVGRSWRLVCVSESLSGIQAAVLGGIAVSVVGLSSVIPGMRVLGRSDSFPALPKVDLTLYRAAGRNNPASDALVAVITRHFRQSAMAPTDRVAPTQAGSGAHE